MYSNIVCELEVIGNIFQKPSLLEREDLFFNQEDFTTPLNRVLFGSVFNLYENGMTSIDIKDIENYLEGQPKSLSIYKTKEQGREVLERLKGKSSLSSFDFYYKKMKKLSLLRHYHTNLGMDLTWLYDDSEFLDIQKREAQEKWFDSKTIGEISDLIIKKIEEVRDAAIMEDEEIGFWGGHGIKEMVEQFRTTPDIGLSLYGKLINGVNRGARKKKLHVISAGSGIGKTRHMIADASVLGYSGYFENGEWISTGREEKVEYIMVEQEQIEVQSCMLCFVSDVNEKKIQIGQDKLTSAEQKRLKKAIDVMEKNDTLHVSLLHEFDMPKLKRTIKNAIIKRGAEYIFFDYVEFNVAILMELVNRAGGKFSLREDQVLFMIMNSLKDIALEYNVYIETATQLNGEWKTSEHMDSSMLAGGKSMDRKIDFGAIMLNTTPQDIEKISPILQSTGMPIPKIKIGVYKNRGNELSNHILWCSDNKGVCKINPMFITDYNYNIVELEEDYKVIISEKNNEIIEHIPIKTELGFENAIKAAQEKAVTAKNDIDIECFDEVCLDEEQTPPVIKGLFDF